MLNESVRYEEVASSLSNSVFLGGSAEAKELLPSGTRLFRFARTAYSPTPCEWWMLFDDFALEDRRVIDGFCGFLQQSGCRFDVNGRFLPVGDIKLGCADPGNRLVLVQTNTPVFAFMGWSTPQRRDPGEPGLLQRGGEFRVWIPGVTARLMNLLPIPTHFLSISTDSQDLPDTRVDSGAEVAAEGASGGGENPET